jgi:hypothetical protein
MDITEVINAILDGDLDDDFEDLVEAIQARRKDIEAHRFIDLRVGDTVRIIGGKKYLIGAEAEVVEKRVTKVTIRFPQDMGRHDPYGKFAGKRWIFPVSAMEKVNN